MVKVSYRRVRVAAMSRWRGGTGASMKKYEGVFVVPVPRVVAERVSMPPTLDDRVRALEGFRYAMLGRVNACQTLILSAWELILRHHSHDPVGAVEEMRALWRKAAETPGRYFHGTDPAQLEAISQEYLSAIDELSAELLGIAQRLAKK